MKRTLLAIALLAALPCAAQDVFINDARVHTAGSRGTLENADVLVRGGVIREVGPDLRAPDGVPVVEAGGKPLTPGLFAGFGSIGLEEVSLEEATVDANLVTAPPEQPFPDQLRPEFDVSRAYNPRTSLLPVARVGGMTFAALMPGGGLLPGQGGVVRLDGGFDAPLADVHTAFAAIGTGLLAQTGHSRAAQYMLLEQALADAALPADEDGELLSGPSRRALASALKQGRLLVTANREADIRQLLGIARRHKIRIGILGGVEAWRAAAELAAAEVPVFVDTLQNLPADFEQLGATLENAARLQRAGVRVGFIKFGDASHNARKLRQLAGNAVANGLPWEAGLAGLTSVPADVLGHGERIGRIEPGKIADLVLWSGDPLDVASMAQTMWLAGKQTPLVSRQTLLRDRYIAPETGMPRSYTRP